MLVARSQVPPGNAFLMAPPSILSNENQRIAIAIIDKKKWY